MIPKREWPWRTRSPDNNSGATGFTFFMSDALAIAMVSPGFRKLLKALYHHTGYCSIELGVNIESAIEE
jgi:hypothetical protein